MKKIPPVVVLRSAIVTLIGLTHLTGFAQEVEVKGEIKCGPPLSGGQGYSQPISMRVQDGYGTGIMETADILENQELVLAADGSVRYNAIGIWKNQPNRRWRIYGIGSLDGLSIKASGGMYGNTAAELVRPKCEIQLTSTSSLKASESKVANYKIETVGEPLGVSPSSITGGARFREWGLERGLPWSLKVTPQNAPRELTSRSPSFAEKLLLSQASDVVKQTKVVLTPYPLANRWIN